MAPSGQPPMPPGFGAPYPPFYAQDSSPSVNQTYYNASASYAYQHPPQPAALQQGLNAQLQNAPPLDANQLAFFWNQVQAGNIPSLTPTETVPQHFGISPPVFPQPIANHLPGIPQQRAQTPPMSSATLNNARQQHQRIDAIARSDREDGEVSEEGELSTPVSQRGSFPKASGYGQHQEDLSHDSHQAANRYGSGLKGSLCPS